MFKFALIASLCLALSAGEPHQKTDDENSLDRWVPIAAHVWTKNENGSNHYLAKGLSGMHWTLNRTLEKVIQAEYAYAQTGDEFWIKRIIDLQERINKIENTLATEDGETQILSECCDSYWDDCSESPLPLCTSNTGEALAYAGHISGGGTEAEAQTRWDGSYPVDITMGCTAVANALSDHTYISETDVYYDSFVCYGRKQGTSNCSAYAFAEVLAGFPNSTYYEMESGVQGCFPQTPLTVSIQGPTYIQPQDCESIIYNLNIENGSGNYTYAWSRLGARDQTGSNYALFTCAVDMYETHFLEVTVTDIGQNPAVSATKTLQISIAPYQ